MTFKKLFIQTLPIVVVFMLVEQLWLNKGQNVWVTILAGVIFLSFTSHSCAGYMV